MSFLVYVLLASSTPPPKPAVKPFTDFGLCQVITQDDVEAAFRRRFGRGAEEKIPGSASCEYMAGEREVVAIKTQHSIARIDLDAEILTLRKAFPDGRVRRAPAVSGRAFFLDLPGVGTQLFVIRGERDFLLVSVMGMGEAKRVAPGASRIARKALERLPAAP